MTDQPLRDEGPPPSPADLSARFAIRDPVILSVCLREPLTTHFIRQKQSIHVDPAYPLSQP